MEPEQVYYVQVFPSKEFKAFRLKRVPNNKNNGLLERDVLLGYIAEKLGQVDQVAIPLPEGMEYMVTIIPAMIETSVSKKLIPLKKIDSLELYAKRSEDAALIERIRFLVNTERDKSIQVDRTVFNGLRLILMATPGDIAGKFYKIPSVTTSLGYEVTIYNGTPEEFQAIAAYDKRIGALNAKLDAPLKLPAPTEPDYFNSLDHISFIAKRDNRIIGYCVCVILRYREEVAPLIKSKLDTLLNSDAGDYQDRFLMGVPAYHLFEIEGLSVSPDETGKKVGLALLYQALRFIRDPRMSRFYPVTHIVSQAASYITKLFLVNEFKFRYHGSNMFANQHFLETIDDTARTHFINVITQLITSYRLLFNTDTLRIMRKWFDTRKQTIQVKEVLSMAYNIIHLYQLYYLLTKTAGRSRVFECTSRETLGLFVSLFRSIVSVFPGGMIRSPYSALRDYFDANIKHIEKNQFVNIEQTIYTQSYTDLKRMGVYKTYGFLEQFEKSTPKEPLRQGYELLYNTLPNLIRLKQLLDKPMKDVILTLKLINAILSKDIDKELYDAYNYEIPPQQLLTILTPLTDIIEGGAIAELDDELNDFITVIKRQEALIGNNERFNAVFAIIIYGVPVDTTSGFDSYVSLSYLKSRWTTIENDILKKIDPTHKVETPIFVAIDDDTDSANDMQICETDRSPQLELLPLSQDIIEIRKDIKTIYDITLINNNPDTLVSYNGDTYSVSNLGEHLVELQQTVKSMDKKEEDTQEYNIEEFIQDDLLADIPYSILSDLSI